MNRETELEYQLAYNARMRGNWTVENEIQYIDKLLDMQFLAKTFKNLEPKPESEQLLQNYIISFRRRYVNRSFDGWETEDYDRVEKYAKDVLGRLRGEE